MIFGGSRHPKASHEICEPQCLLLVAKWAREIESKSEQDFDDLFGRLDPETKSDIEYNHYVDEVSLMGGDEGAKDEPKAARARLLASLEYLNRRLWNDYHTIPEFKHKDRAKIYQLLLCTNDRICRLHGVYEKLPLLGSNEGAEIAFRLREQKDMCEMMGRFADIVAQKRRNASESGVNLLSTDL